MSAPPFFIMTARQEQVFIDAIYRAYTTHWSGEPIVPENQFYTIDWPLNPDWGYLTFSYDRSDISKADADELEDLVQMILSSIDCSAVG